MVNPFDGPLLKVERADHHINELEETIRGHIRAHIEPAMRKKNGDEWQRRAAALPTRLPRHTPTIIGDAVHNLRVSLDHAYWIMVENAGGQFDRRAGFPFGKDRRSLEGSINGWKDSAKPALPVVKHIVGGLEPFEGGKLHLYELHRLDIMDKHEMLLPTGSAFRLEAGKALIAILPNGRTTRFMSEGESTIIAEPAMVERGAPFFDCPGGTLIYTGNLQNALLILFGPGPLQERGAVEALRTLRDNVRGAIESLVPLLR